MVESKKRPLPVPETKQYSNSSNANLLVCNLGIRTLRLASACNVLSTQEFLRFVQTALNKIAINPKVWSSLAAYKPFQPVPSCYPIASDFGYWPRSGINQTNLLKRTISTSIIAWTTSYDQVVEVCTTTAAACKNMVELHPHALECGML